MKRSFCSEALEEYLRAVSDARRGLRLTISGLHRAASAVSAHGRYINMMRIQVPKEKLEEFCRSRHIRWIACFGSVLRDDFRSDSDVDFLVEFAAGHTPGWEIVDIEEDLSSLLGGRKVELVNPKYLNRWIKDRVLAEAEVLYAEG